MLDSCCTAAFLEKFSLQFFFFFNFWYFFALTSLMIFYTVVLFSLFCATHRISGFSFSLLPWESDVREKILNLLRNSFRSTIFSVLVVYFVVYSTTQHSKNFCFITPDILFLHSTRKKKKKQQIYYAPKVVKGNFSLRLNYQTPLRDFTKTSSTKGFNC